MQLGLVLLACSVWGSLQYKVLCFAAFGLYLEWVLLAASSGAAAQLECHSQMPVSNDPSEDFEEFAQQNVDHQSLVH